VTWLPLLVPSALEGNLWGGGTTVPFFFDLEVHIRFPAVVPMLIVAKLVVHRRLHSIGLGFLRRSRALCRFWKSRRRRSRPCWNHGRRRAGVRPCTRSACVPRVTRDAFGEALGHRSRAASECSSRDGRARAHVTRVRHDRKNCAKSINEPPEVGGGPLDYSTESTRSALQPPCIAVQGWLAV